MTSDKMLDYILEKHFSKQHPLSEPVDSDVLTIPNLYRYKFMVIIYEISEVEPPVEEGRKLLLEYKFLNKETKMRLKLAGNRVPVNTMQLFHFFVDDPSRSN